MNYFHIDVELKAEPVRMLIADTVPVVPGEQKEISFQVHYTLPGGNHELLLVLRENGWVNESARIAQAGLPLLWQAMPQLIEPHLLPDEKLTDVSQEEVDRIGARISEYMMPGLRHELGLYNKNLANSFSDKMGRYAKL
ncbi:hypothetical protein [Mucilaginibacter terrae]|uniref:Uncharacterized protein n=1 Tax=Mucilaginibacter terrae TaxID=1955052 RepID=A0ABU3GPE3_9SPHI|nr:hypothetical protein [Mucilaginibacter terrae]MDT3401346.1 hypothetical protein [Mucilaginibacter terrae]